MVYELHSQASLTTIVPILRIERIPEHLADADDAPLDTGLSSTILVPDQYFAVTADGRVKINKKLFKLLKSVSRAAT
jgi:hypothetical protein